MSYGLIICTKCGFAKGIRLSIKTTKCLHCHKRLVVERLPIRYRTESARELSELIRKYNTAHADGTAAYTTTRGAYERDAPGTGSAITAMDERSAISRAGRRDEKRTIEAAAAQPTQVVTAGHPRTRSKRQRTLRTIIADLSERYERGFTEEQFEAAAREHELPLERAEEYLRSLLANGELYEPTPGHYRLIEHDNR